MHSFTSFSLLALGLSLTAIAIPLEERASDLSNSAVTLGLPAPRLWADATDSAQPCGGIAFNGTRTNFPLTGGNLSYVVRADANRLAFNYATDPNANSNSQFTMLTHEASTTTYRGHHCGAAPDFAALGFKAGQQLTIQARWTAGTKQTTLYQCADITLVDRALYVAPAGAMCFTGALTTATVDNNDYTDDLGGAGLTAGQKAGIAVGSVLGGLLLLGAAVYGVRKYRKNAATAKAANYGDDASTLNGAGTPPAVMSQKQLA